MNEKVDIWKKYFRLTKSQSTSFHHKDMQGSNKTDQALLFIREKKDVCTNVLFAYPFSKSKQSE